MESNKFSWLGPLTQNQQDIYFDQQQYPDCALYNVGGYISLPKVNTTAMQQAQQMVEKNHDVFALRVGILEGKTRQWLVPRGVCELDIIDFTTELNPQDAFDSWVSSLFQTPIDMHDGALYKTYLAKTNASCFYFVGIAHHIMMDGWGFANWAHELGKCYNAIVSHQSVTTGQTRWKEVVERDQAYLNSTRFTRHESYWRRELAAHSGCFLQPKYRSHFNSAKMIPGRRKNICIGRSRHKALLGLAKELGVPVAQLYFAVIAHYFSKAYDQQEMCFGFPVHNRKGHAEKQLLGTFSSISPVMLQPEKCDSLISLCKQVASQLRQVFRHQGFPVSGMRQLVDGLAQENHLYDVTFNYIDLESGFQLGAREAELTYCSHQNEQLPIKFSVWDHGSVQDVVISVDFNLAYFSDWDIHLLELRLLWLFEQVCQHEGRINLNDFSILPPQETQHIFSLSKGERHDAIEYQSVFDLVKCQAQKTPDNVALFDGDKAYSYRECVLKAEQLATVIQHNFDPLLNENQIVGICMSRKVDLVIAMLAVNRLGAAYVALDKDYPLDRIEHMIQDANLHLVLVDEPVENLSALTSLRQGNVTTLLQQARDVQLPLPSVNYSDLAYIIYTSGSTGKPKGVMITQGNALSLLSWAGSAFTKQQLAYVLAGTSVCFDLSLFEIFAPLSVGGTARLVPNVLALADIQDADRVSLINTVPSAIEALLKARAIPGSIEVINLAGEPLLHDTVRRLKSQLPVTRVFDLYGPSEDTTYSTFGERFVGHGANIGRPLPDTLAFVLNERQQLVPTGVEGELYLGGPGLSPGYFGQPQLSAEKFLTIQVTDTSQPTRLYKTGDQVRWQEDGTLQYLGRLDNQVKLRGFRVELEEIKNALLSIEGVEELQVFVTGQYQDAQLVAFVVMQEYHNLQHDQVIAQLQRETQALLPEYMVPNRFQLCEAFPRLPNGKVDTRSLLAKLQVPSNSVIAPSNQVEQMLCGIWSELLGCQPESIGVQDNFFRLGGNSLLCLQMLHRLKERSIEQLTIAEVFKAPTIQALAQKIQNAQASDTRGFGELVVTPSSPSRFALSYSQYRIWFMHEMRAVGASQHVPVRLTYAAPLQLLKLQEVLDSLIVEHDILRTLIRVDANGEPEQHILQEMDAPVQYIDVSTSTIEEQDARVQQALLVSMMAPFELLQPPLFRTLVIKRAEEAFDIQFTFHHIICDGWSALRFLELAFAKLDVSGMFQSRESAELVRIKPEYNYIDYCYAQQAFLISKPAQAQREFWRETLSASPKVLALPWNTGDKRAAIQAGSDASLIISQPLTLALKQLAKAHNCTLFNVLHTSLAILLARITGQHDLIIGSPSHGRNVQGTETQLGVFLNLLPLRSQFSPDDSFSHLLENSRKVTSDAFAHQDIPYEELMALANGKRENQGGELFNVMLNMLNFPSVLAQYPQVTLDSELLTSIPSKFDLTLYVVEQQDISASGHLKIHASYNETRYSREAIMTALEQLHALLRQAVQNPQQSWLDYSLEEGGKDAISPYPETLLAPSLNHLFNQVVERNPKAAAVDYMGRQFTYKELDQLSSHCAVKLQQQNVSSGDAVAIFARRVPELIVAILGVLKAGAHFTLLAKELGDYRLRSQLEIISPAAWIGFDDETIDMVNSVGFADVQGMILAAESVSELPQNVQFEQPDTCGDSLAYIAFTSGTTGEPKAIYGQHGSISAFIPVVQKRYALNAQAKVGMLSSLTHDPLLRDVFFSLGCGGCLHIPEEKTYQSDNILRWLADNKISTVNLTPSFSRLLASYPYLELPNIRHVFFGGESLMKTDVSGIKRLCQNATLTNLYGTTETGRALAAFELNSERSEYYSSQFKEKGIYPVGKALAGGRLLVLNHKQNECDKGEVGQIAIASSHLPVGGQQVIGASSYIETRIGRAYKTGDLGRYLENGDVECIGRRDHQIKLSGYRIEPSEIEFHLLSHPDVLNACVFSSRTENESACLKAAVITRKYLTWETSMSDALRKFVSNRLPLYAIPTQFVSMEQFPLTYNNKVDREKLIQVASKLIAETSQKSVIPPTTDTESALHQIWCQLFEKQQVSVAEEFYALGGNSLLASRLISQVRQQYEVEFSYQDFITGSSIRSVAAHIDGVLTQRAVITNQDKNKKMTLRI